MCNPHAGEPITDSDVDSPSPWRLVDYRAWTRRAAPVDYPIR